LKSLGIEIQVRPVQDNRTGFSRFDHGSIKFPSHLYRADSMTTLVLSSRHTEDNQSLWRAAIGRGWSVERARGLRVPQIDDLEIVLYVESLFATAIAGQIGVSLLELPEDWLVNLPHEFTNRVVDITTLGEARESVRPSFVKPPNDKLFAAKVYETGTDLPDEFDDEMQVLVSEPVEWQDEFRCFCLDGSVLAISPYLRDGQLAKETKYAAADSELEAASSLAEQVLAATDSTPRSVVIDVGRIKGCGWSVVEANAAWGSGIYGCDPDAVLDVIRHATVNTLENGQDRHRP
jgi:hypothetical protein